MLLNFSSWKKNYEDAGTRVDKGKPFKRRLKNGKVVEVTGRRRRAIRKALITKKTKELKATQTGGRALEPFVKPKRGVYLDNNLDRKLIEATHPGGMRRVGNIDRGTLKRNYYPTPEGISSFLTIEKSPGFGRDRLYGSNFNPKYPPLTQEVPIGAPGRGANLASPGMKRVFSLQGLKRRMSVQDSIKPISSKARTRMLQLGKSLARKMGR